MNSTTLKAFLMSLLAIFILAQNSVSDKSRLDLKKFDGKWSGEGTYYLPFTGIPTSIEATAQFDYNSAKKYLRTAITAERFLLKYSDSGKLAYGKHQDSLNWEIWNSFGYHVQYSGGVKNNTIHGQRKWGKYIYDLHVDIVSDDSMKIKITSTDEDGESSNVAAGFLKRTND